MIRGKDSNNIGVYEVDNLCDRKLRRGSQETTGVNSTKAEKM